MSALGFRPIFRIGGRKHTTQARGAKQGRGAARPCLALRACGALYSYGTDAKPTFSRKVEVEEVRRHGLFVELERVRHEKLSYIPLTESRRSVSSSRVM